jgi:hypothetical protein
VKFKRTFLVAGALGCIVLWGIAPAVLHFFAQEYLIRIQERGTRVRVDGLEGRRVGLAAEAIEGWVQIPVEGLSATIPLSVRAEHPRADLNVPLLSPWSPRVSLKTLLYGGQFDGVVSELLSSASISGSLRGLDVAQYPQAQAFGVDSGLLDLHLKNHGISGPSGKEALYSVSLKGFSWQVPPTFRSFTKIDSITDTDIIGRASISKTGRLSIPECNLKSSLGLAKLQAAGNLSGGSLRDLSGSFEIDLNTPDGANLRPWLGLLVSSPSLPAEGAIHCEFRLGPCNYSGGTHFRIGRHCIRLQCS